MNMFEFLFIQEAGQRLWELQLASLDSLTKYFFVHGQFNYT